MLCHTKIEDMIDRIDSQTKGQRAEIDQQESSDALDATGVYETSTGTVLYDTEEPLAWLQGDNAVVLSEMR